MEPNRSIMTKADMQIADLIADGGYLQEEQATAFVVNLIKAAVMLPMITVQPLRSHTKIIDKVGLNGRVLRPGTSGHAVPPGDRAKPVTAHTTLETRLMKGEIRLNDEVLEDQIEGGQFKTTVMNMMSDQVALDMDELAVNGDTTSADPFLAQFDGMLVGAGVHTVNAGTVPLSKSHLKAAINSMPSQYNRNRAAQRFLTSERAENDYRDYLADRATVLGDTMIQQDSPVRYGNRPILPIPMFPDNLGGGHNCTNVLLCDPKNAVWGVWRRVRVETDRDITTGEWVMVVTLRAGFKWQETDAVVKILNVKTS
jgi:HK97 family phage major capsid protein